jgi:prepilin peptidase CpaA
MNLLILIRTFLWAGCLSLAAASGATDLRYRIIPNRFVVVIAASALALCFMMRPGLVWLSVLISVVLFLGLGTLTHYGLLGGGDAKLMAAVSLLVPPEHVGLLLTEIVLAGGLLSLAYLAAYGILWRAPHSLDAAATAAPAKNWLNGFVFDEHERIVTGRSIPYALAIMGGVTFYLATELYQCFYATFCSL